MALGPAQEAATTDDDENYEQEEEAHKKTESDYSHAEYSCVFGRVIRCRRWRWCGRINTPILSRTELFGVPVTLIVNSGASLVRSAICLGLAQGSDTGSVPCWITLIELRGG